MTADQSSGFVVQALACRRGGRPVLMDVSFAVPPGGALQVTGRNGAGKSSLLRVLAGLCPPAQGTMHLAGVAFDAEPAGYRRLVGLLGHDAAIKLTETPLETLTFWAAYGGADGVVGARPPHANPSDALHAVGLADMADLPVRYLSSGQRRRLGLARLLVRGNPLWLLDEPAVGLDEAAIAQLGAVIDAQRAAGGIVVAATHVDFGLTGASRLALAPAGAEMAA